MRGLYRGEQRDVALLMTYHEKHFLHINANVPGLFFYPVWFGGGLDRVNFVHINRPLLFVKKFET